MNQFLDAIGDVIESTPGITINDRQKTMYEYFVADQYPALCLQPKVTNSILERGLGWDYEDSYAGSAFFVEKMPEDRDMTPFISNVKTVVDTLKSNPQLNGVSPAGTNIKVIYHSNVYDGNNEFVAEIQIEGRNS